MKTPTKMNVLLGIPLRDQGEPEEATKEDKKPVVDRLKIAEKCVQGGTLWK